MEVLGEWLESGDIEHIRRAAWLIHECNRNRRYMELARKNTIASRVDEETEDLVRSGIQHQEGVTFGRMEQHVEARIASLTDWLTDDDVYVKRFARRAATAMRDLPERWDASLDDVFEEG
jgi:hypothetical protein